MEKQPSEVPFVKVPTDIMEALVSIRIPGEARQVFDLIIRKTFGFNKTQDFIPLSQFSHFTGIKKPHVIRAIKRLHSMNLITKKGNGYGATYGINNELSEWKPLPKKVTVTQKGKDFTQKGNKSLPKKVPSIDSTKDIIKGIPKSEYQVQALRITKAYFQELQKAYPDIDHWQELINADLYRLANPKKGKRNDHLFLRNWFSNALKYRRESNNDSRRQANRKGNVSSGSELEKKYGQYD